MKTVMNEEIVSALLSLAEREKLEDILDSLESLMKFLLSPDSDTGMCQANLVCNVYAVNELRSVLQRVKNAMLEEGGSK